MGMTVGLFRNDPEVDGDIAAVLLTQGKAALRALSKHQLRFHQLRRPYEQPMLAVVDDMSPARIVILAGRRAFVFAPATHTPERVADVAEIDRASLEESSKVCLNELNLGFWFTFRRVSDAHAFAVRINRSILANRPRSMPRLYPDYYTEILRSAGVTPTPEVMASLVERTVANFGGQAGAFCAHNGDRATFDAFLQTFAPKVVLEDQSNVLDEMVDWLWVRNPGFHYGIERQLAKWREKIGDPNGTFFRGGTSGPFWDNGAQGAVELWTLVFDSTKFVSVAPC